MPKLTKKAAIRATAYFPPATYDKLVTRSKQNYRSLTSEILAAVEKGLQEAETREPAIAQ